MTLNPKTWLVSDSCIHMFFVLFEFFSFIYFRKFLFAFECNMCVHKPILLILSPCYRYYIRITVQFHDPYLYWAQFVVNLLTTSSIYMKSFNYLHVKSSSRIRFIERLMSKTLPFRSTHQWQNSWWGKRRSSSLYCRTIDFRRFISILGPILDRNIDSALLIRKN